MGGHRGGLAEPLARREAPGPGGRGSALRRRPFGRSAAARRAERGLATAPPGLAGLPERPAHRPAHQSGPGRGHTAKAGGGAAPGARAGAQAAKVIGGAGAARERSAGPHARAGPARGGNRSGARQHDAGCCRGGGAGGRACTQLRRAGHEAGGNAGAEHAHPEEDGCGEDRAHHVGEGDVLVAGERVRDGREQCRADADDDGEHHQLDPGRDDIAEDALCQERCLVPERKGHEHEPGKRRQLELEDGDEELDGEDEEGREDNGPGNQQDRDQDEIVEEGDGAEQAAGLVEEGERRLEPDAGNIARPHEVARGERAGAGLDPERREALEQDAGQELEIADEPGEEADIEHLADEAGDDIAVF